jgi:hypothetical protein
MNKTKRAVVSIIIITVATVFMISATYISNLNKITRISIASIYLVIFSFTIVSNIICVFKNK